LSHRDKETAGDRGGGKPTPPIDGGGSVAARRTRRSSTGGDSGPGQSGRASGGGKRENSGHGLLLGVLRRVSSGASDAANHAGVTTTVAERVFDVKG
jgi:hypothetical protein